MRMVIVLVFVGVFAVVALLLIATGSGAAAATKQVLATLTQPWLLRAGRPREQILNLRKRELHERHPMAQQQAAELRSSRRKFKTCFTRPISNGRPAACSRCARPAFLFRLRGILRFGSLLIARRGWAANRFCAGWCGRFFSAANGSTASRRGCRRRWT